MKRLEPRPCRTCGQWIGIRLLKRREKLRAEKIKKGMMETKKTVGRPKKVAYEKIVELRKLGYSHKLIAFTLKCSREASVRASSKAGLANKIIPTKTMKNVKQGKPSIRRTDGHRPWLRFCGGKTQKE